MLLLINNNDSMSDAKNVQNGHRTIEQDHRQRYERFVEALENASNEEGTTNAHFDALAAQLGWELEEVQLYAYQYFVSLCESDQDSPDQASNGRAWTTQESALFDTLMARYYEPEESSETQAWAQRVAERLPGRTATDVRHRFLQLQEEQKK